MYVNGVNLMLEASNVIGNSALNGGGMFGDIVALNGLWISSANISNSRILRNSAKQGGGGCFFKGVRLILDSALLVENSAV